MDGLTFDTPRSSYNTRLFEDFWHILIFTWMIHSQNLILHMKAKLQIAIVKICVKCWNLEILCHWNIETLLFCNLSSSHSHPTIMLTSHTTPQWTSLSELAGQRILSAIIVFNYSLSIYYSWVILVLLPFFNPKKLKEE